MVNKLIYIIMDNNINIHFADLIKKISALMPSFTLVFILITYIVMSAINAYFLPLPIILSVSSALILALGRFLIVFTDFLLITKNNNSWQKILAGILTLLALVELWFSLNTTFPEFKVAIFLNIGGIIILGLALELSFLEKARLTIRETAQKRSGDEVGQKLSKSNFHQKEMVV